MSLVTTARLYFGHSPRLRRSTSAVFPDPTGPAMPTRNARANLLTLIFAPPSPVPANRFYRRVSHVLRRRRNAAGQPEAYAHAYRSRRYTERAGSLMAATSALRTLSGKAR